MGSLDLPKLRPLSARHHQHDGLPFVALTDPLETFSHPVLIPLEGFQLVVRHFDGQTSREDIQSRVVQETGRAIDSADLERLVIQLDQAMVLDGPTFQAYRERFAREAIRPAAMAGRSYPSEKSRLAGQLEQYFSRLDGAVPFEPTEGCRLRGVVSPHIDFERGAEVYPFAYREIVSRSDADVFVILGVAHQYCERRFALTRKHFDTPLGLLKTDRSYVDRLAEIAGPHLFEDELTHRTEHSIEFQVVFLNHVFAERRPIEIVPILVGSFHDLMEQGIDPIEEPEVRRFVEALRTVERESGKKVAYIGGIDLCHVGPEFGDPKLVDSETLETVGAFDRAMIDRAVGTDAKGWFQTAAAIRNRWRVCGLAATYTMLHAMGPTKGRLLKYGQSLDDQKKCCVTFASLAFDSDEVTRSA